MVKHTYFIISKPDCGRETLCSKEHRKFNTLQEGWQKTSTNSINDPLARRNACIPWAFHQSLYWVTVLCRCSETRFKILMWACLSKMWLLTWSWNSPSFLTIFILRETTASTAGKASPLSRHTLQSAWWCDGALILIQAIAFALAFH